MEILKCLCLGIRHALKTGYRLPSPFPIPGNYSQTGKMNYSSEVMMSSSLELWSGATFKKPFSFCPLDLHFLHRAMVTVISAAIVLKLDISDALSLTHC